MFKPTDRQMSLDSPVLQLSEGAARRLRASWADAFQRKVLPLLLRAEDEFAELYADVGRPNWSVARLLGICYLQELHDLDDQRALDSLAFDVRWQHALGLTADDGYLSRRSLVEFRSRLVDADPEMVKLRELFDRISDTAMADLGRAWARQRMDSTRICSNITTHGRVDLFRKTLVHVLRWLAARRPDPFATLDPEMRKLVDPTETGWFAPPKGEQRRVLLIKLARWLVEVREAFADDDEITADERYALVCRILREHCSETPSPPRTLPTSDDDPEGGAGGEDHTSGVAGASAETSSEAPGGGDDSSSSRSESASVTLRRKPVPAGASLQSPFDPDATYGHKGQGYHLHVAETCGHDGPELITDFEVSGAHEHDSTRATAILERLAKRDRQPETMYADGGYANGGNILEASALGTDLYAPVTRGRLPEDMIGRDRFVFEDDSGEVVRCPADHPPVRHGYRVPEQGGTPTWHAFFDRKTCNGCVYRGRCVVRPSNNKRSGRYHLDIEPHLRARDEALARQDRRDWWLDYRIRSGVEATPSELKRAHGIGRLRVRRLSRVVLAVSLKVTACNIKRWLRASTAAVGAADAPQVAVEACRCALTLIGVPSGGIRRWCGWTVATRAS